MSRFTGIVLMVLTISIAGLTNLAYGAPSVTGISGGVSHNGTVTVTGNGFGTKSTAAPNLWDTVENQSSYSGLSDGATIPVGTGYPWRENVNNQTKYRTALSEQRGVSTASYKATSSLQGKLGARQVPGANYLYVSWWWKTANSVGGTNHSSKFLRVSDYRDPSNKTFSWTQMQAIVWQNPSYAANVWYTYSPSINTWHFHEAFFDSVNRKFTVTVDGAPIYNNVDWSSASSTVFDEVWSVGWDAGGTSPIAITSWMDDIYVDNTQARVMICSGSSWGNRSRCEMQIPSAWSGTSITAKVNQGSFASNGTGYLYVVDSAGAVNSAGFPVTFGGSTTAPPPTTDGLPSVSITSPTSQAAYSTAQNSITLAGTSTDDKGIANVSWINSQGGNGTATNSSGNWSSWSISNIPLQPGTNTLTVTATDAAGQTGTAILTVTYSSSSAMLWSATSQTGDSNWKDSNVAYCVRLLVQGNQIAQSGDIIQLAFQGRVSGNYTIQEVSIGEKDPNVAGNIVNGTWTRVTFDNRALTTWQTDVATVLTGSQKLSDKIPFTVQPGKNYYVTFKMNSPSVYLNPPSGYQELYFTTADYANEINWAGKGYLVAQDYHALSHIYVTPGPASRPRPPQGLTITNAGN